MRVKRIVPVLCLTLLLLLSACGSSNRKAEDTLPLLSDVTILAEDEKAAAQRDALWLQIDLARTEWACADPDIGGEALKTLAEMGKAAIAVAENPAADVQTLKEARLALKDAVDVFRKNVPGSGDLTALGRAIVRGEEMLSSLTGDKKSSLGAAISEAYLFYRADVTASEAESATETLNAAIDAVQS